MSTDRNSPDSGAGDSSAGDSRAGDSSDIGDVAGLDDLYARREPVRRGIPLLLGAVGLPLLAVWALIPVRHHVEDSLKAKSVRALDGSGVNGVEVRMKGRDARLVGTVPDEASLVQAHELVRSRVGVRHVDASGLTIVGGNGGSGGSPAADTSVSPTTPAAATTAAATTVSDTAPTTAAAATTVASAETTEISATTIGGPTTTLTVAAAEVAGDISAVLATGIVEFDVGRADLTTAGKATVAKLAAALAKQPAVAVAIAGHTDNLGSASRNAQLSQARADTVKSSLIARGIAATRLTAKGYGSTKPIADNATAAGRRKNRRIEFTPSGG